MGRQSVSLVHLELYRAVPWAGHRLAYRNLLWRRPPFFTARLCDTFGAQGDEVTDGLKGAEAEAKAVPRIRGSEAVVGFSFVWSDCQSLRCTASSFQASIAHAGQRQCGPRPDGGPSSNQTRHESISTARVGDVSTLVPLTKQTVLSGRAGGLSWGRSRYSNVLVQANANVQWNSPNFVSAPSPLLCTGMDARRGRRCHHLGLSRTNL